MLVATMKRAGVVAFVVGLLIGLPAATASRGGVLDTTFGAGGKVITDLGGNDLLLSAAIQADGKVVAAGLSEDPATHATRWVVARYDRNGRLDPSFDGDGLAIMSGGEAEGIAIQSDGKIVAAGDAFGPVSRDLTVVRYNPDGSLDRTFGGGGVVQTDFGTSTSDYGGHVVIGADGKITVAGVTRPLGPLNLNFAIARYNPDGSLDSSFGSGGRVVTDLGQNDDPSDLALAPDGKLVVVGFTVAGNALVGERIAIARYNPNGSLDSSFDGDGVIVGEEGSPRAVVLQRSGKLVIAGGKGPSNTRVYGVFRYDVSGAVDTSFGSGGNGFVPAIKNGFVYALAQDARQRLVVGGSAGTGNDFGVARLDANGKLDPRFGAGGEARADVGSLDIATAIAVATDGKIVAAGDTGATSSDWALTRFLPTYCVVPNVRGQTLTAARRNLSGADCSVGRVRSVASKKVRKQRVISQTPKAGKQLAEGARVSLVVSRGTASRRR